MAAAPLGNIVAAGRDLDNRERGKMLSAYP